MYSGSLLFARVKEKKGTGEEKKTVSHTNLIPLDAVCLNLLRRGSARYYFSRRVMISSEVRPPAVPVKGSPDSTLKPGAQAIAENTLRFNLLLGVACPLLHPTPPHSLPQPVPPAPHPTTVPQTAPPAPPSHYTTPDGPSSAPFPRPRLPKLAASPHAPITQLNLSVWLHVSEGGGQRCCVIGGEVCGGDLHV